MRLRYSLLAALLLGAPAVSAQTLTAALSGDNEVPAVTTEATGLAFALVYDGADGTDTDTVVVGGSFSGLESDYNAAVGSHLHGGAAGENGPVRYPLSPTLDADNRGGTFEPQNNTLIVRETFADSLREGLVYVNVHTVDNGSGEIRGQLRVSTPIASGDIVINEFLADPAADAPGDANGDGTRESSQDEFIELVNTTDAEIDLSGYVIEDEASQNNADDNAFIRHFFPAGSVIPAGGALVVFGGGTPTGAFGGAVVQTAMNPTTTFSPQIGLNNGGDKITLATSFITGDESDNDGTVVAEVEYGGDVMDESFARNPDLTGDFVAQSSVLTGVLFTPGTKNVDGSSFGTSTAGESGPEADGYELRATNPARAGASVTLVAPLAAEVTVELFDVVGRRVATLVDGTVAGEQTLRLSDALAPGVYVLRLTTDAGSLAQTITVVR